MTNSAEQLYHGRFDTAAERGSTARLFIDLDICSTQCPGCSIQCSYYDLVPNNGIHSVAELATYALVCRRCEDPHCVKACPVEALEQQPDKGSMLIRHNMLCLSCHSCSLACPYGTIYPEHVPLLVHNCDFCLDRRDQQDEPLCVQTCPYAALRLLPADRTVDERTFVVGQHLMVHSTHWEQEKA
jgi:Fe-S-cluster-containing dehydrogenase component